MGFIADTEDAALDAINAGNRSTGHVALGVLICLTAVGLTAAIATARPQPIAPGARPQHRSSLGRVVWPAIFSVSTLAAIRVWNAPASPARTKALALWGGLQGLNAFWMLLRPRDRLMQVFAGLTTAVATTVYAHAASKVDAKAAGLVGPSGWMSLAGLFTKKEPAPLTVH